MKVKPRTVKRDVNLLTDPNPTHLSGVTAGANQAPWKSLKSHDQEPEMPNAAVPKTQATKKALLSKLQLSKSVYPTEAAVKKYMDDHDFDDTSYALDGADEDVWVAKSTQDFTGLELSPKARSVATKDAGVTMFVYDVVDKGATEDGDPDEEDEEDEPAVDDGKYLPGKNAAGHASKTAVKPKPAVKAARAAVKHVKPKDEGTSDNVSKTAGEVTVAEPMLAFRGDLAQKYDWYSSYMSGGTTLAEVFKDGMTYDDLPPGVDEVLDALYNATGNILGDANISDKEAALKSLGSEYAGIVVGLNGLFRAAQADLTNEQAQKWATGFAASVVSSTKSAIAPVELATSTDPKPASAAKKETTEDEGTPDHSTPDMMAMIKSAMGEMLAPLTSRLDAVESGVKKTERSFANVSKTVKDIATATPTRKSMSDAFDDLQADPQVTAAEAQERLKKQTDYARGMLGGRPRTH